MSTAMIPVIPDAKAVRQSIPQSLRTAVMERDHYRCVYCGTHRELAIDHIHPVALGGTNDFDNLQTLCGPCNRAKGARIQHTLQFPGMGDPVGTTVTIPDGEGGHRVKTLRLATIADLEADLTTHSQNIAGGPFARSTADRRNRRLIPVMKERSFDYAGDALAAIGDEAS